VSTTSSEPDAVGTTTGTYSTKEELREKERKWAAAGLIFIGVIVALAIIVVAAGA